MQWSDTKNGYGWLSIILHWLTAAIIIALWGIGDWMQGLVSEGSNDLLSLHIAIASTAWLLIVFRIFWRIKSSHPKIEGQGRLTRRLAKFTHYLLLIAVLLMLLSGPTMLWSAGLPIEVFKLFSIPSPIAPTAWLNILAAKTHAYCANVIIILILLHVSSAFKHLMFNDDDTFISMLVAAKKSK